PPAIRVRPHRAFWLNCFSRSKRRALSSADEVFEMRSTLIVWLGVSIACGSARELRSQIGDEPEICLVRPDLELTGRLPSLPAFPSDIDLAVVGDFDGDGTADVALTERSRVESEVDCATASARFAIHSSRTGQALFETRVDESCEDLMAIARAMGDVDGDGVPELAIGAPGLSGSGRVALVDGASFTIRRMILGETDGERFGGAI